MDSNLKKKRELKCNNNEFECNEERRRQTFIRNELGQMRAPELTLIDRVAFADLRSVRFQYQVLAP